MSPMPGLPPGLPAGSPASISLRLYQLLVLSLIVILLSSLLLGLLDVFQEGTPLSCRVTNHYVVGLVGIEVRFVGVWVFHLEPGHQVGDLNHLVWDVCPDLDEIDERLFGSGGRVAAVDDQL